jgi:unsaturated rhamnogalacturonyl hydrolase
LQKVTRRNGAIDFSQGDTKGIGMHSQRFDILPFTQGFVLRTFNLKT